MMPEGSHDHPKGVFWDVGRARLILETRPPSFQVETKNSSISRQKFESKTREERISGNRQSKSREGGKRSHLFFEHPRRSIPLRESSCLWGARGSRGKLDGSLLANQMALNEEGHGQGGGEGANRRRLVAFGGFLIGGLLIAAAATKHEMGRTSLTATNQFESQPAFGAKWTQSDMQHHLVRNFQESQVCAAQIRIYLRPAARRRYIEANHAVAGGAERLLSLLFCADKGEQEAGRGVQQD
jgi:hypothetical protein